MAACFYRFFHSRPRPASIHATADSSRHSAPRLCQRASAVQLHSFRHRKAQEYTTRSRLQGSVGDAATPSFSIQSSAVNLAG